VGATVTGLLRPGLGLHGQDVQGVSATDAACAGMEHCGNGVDDDTDGQVDCDDNDCLTHPWCEIIPL
jgi:hypothetical protein